MRKNHEEESLMEMLRFCNVTKLPAPLSENEKKIWSRAIVKVAHRSGHHAYVAAKHDFFSWEEIAIKKVSDTPGDIVRVIEIYPYEFLEDAYIPNVYKRQNIIDFVKAYSNEDEEYLYSLKKESLQALFYNICINQMIERKIADKPIGYYKKEEEPLKEEENENNKEESGNGTESGDDNGTSGFVKEAGSPLLEESGAGEEAETDEDF
jgi:hypothetical protein